ncbi:hypothetical protein QR680_004744 [Steinernema hermaphroditum]|uniref:Protein kinase domain-containing protein n=1 Tax=Steinernema hermaphroditum TaxID=289476 RepID=A0AA39HQV8_9BILA|nr:hypothetical protein QR680_004744 [Steinernema hermaphroditum]
MELRNNRTPKGSDGAVAPVIAEANKKILGIDGMKVRQVIGSGSYGTVVLYAAAKKSVAVKSMKCKSDRDKVDVAMEVEALRLFKDCPHVIDYIGDLLEGDIHHVVMDAAQKDFTQLIEGMSSRKAKQYFKQLIAGVGYMHNKGFAHRDLKTPNLLLGRDNLLKICDFNMAISFISGDGLALYCRGSCGTEEYHPPEMIAKPYDIKYCPRAYDIWACGIIFAEFFTGDLPWDVAKESHKPFADFVTGITIPQMTNPQEAFFRFICSLSWAQRPKIEDILKHPFMRERTSTTQRTPLGPAQINTPGATPVNRKRKGKTGSSPGGVKRVNVRAA